MTLQGDHNAQVKPVTFISGLGGDRHHRSLGDLAVAGNVTGGFHRDTG